MPSNELGEFLKAHRARLDPQDVGFPAQPGRRVAGLRREEVAVLAGVSSDYYTRLEQGRERHPSASVLDALGRALRLSLDSREHLHRLAGLRARLGPSGGNDHVHPALAEMLDAFPTSAAYVLGRSFDVLATNRVAAALLSPFAGWTNMVRILFTHPQARVVFVDWTEVVTNTVRALRLQTGRFPADPQIDGLVAEMTDASADFRALWADRTVGGLGRAFKVFVHPDVGRIELTYQTFDVRDAPAQQLLVGTPAASSRSAEALAYLSSMHA